jgi:hypothetical protein
MSTLALENATLTLSLSKTQQQQGVSDAARNAAQAKLVEARRVQNNEII